MIIKKNGNQTGSYIVGIRNNCSTDMSINNNNNIIIKKESNKNSFDRTN